MGPLKLFHILTTVVILASGASAFAADPPPPTTTSTCSFPPGYEKLTGDEKKRADDSFYSCQGRLGTNADLTRCKDLADRARNSKKEFRDVCGKAKNTGDCLSTSASCASAMEDQDLFGSDSIPENLRGVFSSIESVGAQCSTMTEADKNTKLKELESDLNTHEKEENGLQKDLDRAQKEVTDNGTRLQEKIIKYLDIEQKLE